MRKNKERGAIVVEATISLTAFMFTIFTILSIVNICFIQAKMGVALNYAAKEISQYSYLYYKLNIDEIEQDMNQGTEEARDTAKQTIDGIGSLMNTISDAQHNFDTGNFENLISDIEDGAKSVDSLITMYADQLADDPKAFIIGMGKMAGNELGQEGKKFLAQVLAKTFMKKNLMAFPGDDPDLFLKRYHVVNGMSGLDFDGTTLMAFGESADIYLVVSYDVSVIRLLNLDFKFTFKQIAKTKAWGNGVSLVVSTESEEKPNEPEEEKESIWDMTNSGKLFVAEEKKLYTYSASRYFDIYRNNNGENEFITVFSCDTKRPSYDTVDEVKRRITNVYNTMKNSVKKLPEEIEVEMHNGEKVTLTSPTKTRTYKLIMIVPDDVDMKMVKDAVKKFNQSNKNVVVEIKNSYGHPNRDTEKTSVD